MTIRCPWAEASDLERIYHDTEWGAPQHDDRKLFEFLVLEGAQAGLSWRTILGKRQGYRECFAGFDPEAVARFDEARLAAILANPTVVRNRLKIHSAVNNARRFLEVASEFGGFERYIWGFVDGKPIINGWTQLSQVPAATAEATAMSKDLKRRGFSFIGPTVCYAFMQATGMVNDHLVSCFRHAEVMGPSKG